MFYTLFALLIILVSYLSGSICSAVLISRLCSLPDPRLEGSKNPGATNVLRLAGKKYAIMVLVADMLKGLLPVLLARLLGLSELVISLACLSAVLGHVFPVFFEFQGGKGVATALGVLIGFHPLLGLLVLLTWLGIAAISRFSSLASILSISIAPLYYILITHHLLASIPLLMITCVILFKHKSNIKRLIEKSEPKIQLKSKLKHSS